MSEDVVALRAQVERLTAEVAVLNNHRFVRLHNSIWRLIGFRFVSGLAFGLGTVLGGSILLSMLGYALAQMDFIPIVGDWAARIAAEMQSGR